MALTPEDVVTKEFQHVRFKDGFDPDEVDDFLDEVVVEWRKTVEENASLKAALEEARAGLSAAPADGGAAVAGDASANSASIIALAQRLHDEHVAEGEAKHKELVSAGEQQQAKLLSEAQAEADRILGEANAKSHQEKVSLEAQKSKLEQAIKELREYEAQYRGQLKALIEKHLNDLNNDAVAE